MYTQVDAHRLQTCRDQSHVHSYAVLFLIVSAIYNPERKSTTGISGTYERRDCWCPTWECTGFGAVRASCTSHTHASDAHRDQGTNRYEPAEPTNLNAGKCDSDATIRSIHIYYYCVMYNSLTNIRFGTQYQDHLH